MRQLAGRLSYANVVATLALVIAVGGGAAYAANTVFSTDIVNGEVKAPDIATAAVTAAKLGADSVSTGKIADGSVRSRDVLDDSLTGADLADVGSLQSHTARLTDTAGGSAASENLFAIGGADLSAFCAVDNETGSLRAGIEPVVDATGPVLVSGDFAVALRPDDVQFIVIVNRDAGIGGQERSFAILDHGGESASGVAAVSVDQATGECVITAEAVG